MKGIYNLAVDDKSQ